jgi:hypothetical protein
MNSDITALLAITLIFGAPVAAWIISRVLAHQERIEMIRRGFVPPPDPRAMRRAARAGWQQPPGVGYPPPPPPPQGAPMPPPPGMAIPDDCQYPQAQLRKGITVTLIGLALLIGLGTIGHGATGPWLLGGLIPMFVGIAQIINAVLNGAHFPGLSTGVPPPYNTNFGPPHDAGVPPRDPGVPPPSGPYAWRPGPTTPIESEKNNNAGS